MEPEYTHALGRLIEHIKAVESKDGKPWSDADLARRAQSHGSRSASKSNIGRLRSEPIESMTVRQIKMLQQALQVPAERIVDAYLESMGLRPRSQPPVSIEDAMAGDDRLTTDDKELLGTVLRFLLKRRKKLADQNPGLMSETHGSDLRTTSDPHGTNGYAVKPIAEAQRERDRSRATYVSGDSPADRGDVSDDPKRQEAQQVQPME